MHKKKIDLRLPLLFIWPFGAFLLSLKTIRSPFSAWVYILFSTLLGYSFSFSYTSADSYRVAWVFRNFDYTDLSYVLAKYLDGAYPDFYKYLMYGIVQKFSTNPKVLFALFGFVFGYFSYKSLKLFFSDSRLQFGLYVSLIALVYFSHNSLININGARFATAAIIALCAVISIFIHNKRVWFIPLISTIFFHFSFLFFVPILLIIYIFQNKLISESHTQKWIFWFYIFAFILSFLHSTNIFNLEMLTQFLPRSIGRKVEIYNSDELSAVIEERNTTLFHTVKNIFASIVRTFYLVVILYIKKKIKTMESFPKDMQRLFNLCLLLFAITYTLFIIPSGGRFATIATQLFLFFLVRFYLIDTSKGIKRLILGLIPVYTFFILFNVGFLGYNLISPTLWYGNLFWILAEGWEFVFDPINYN